MVIKTLAAVGACAILALSGLSTTAVSQPASGVPTGQGVTTIVIGSGDFPESQLIATIYAKALTAKGIVTTLRTNIGSREVYMPALLDGSIDLLPEYAGALLSYLDKKATAHSSTDVEAALKVALPSGISILTPSTAQNADTLVVTRSTATKYNLKTIADLAPVAGEFVLGGPPEWKTRKEGVVGLKTVYNLKFKSFKGLDAGGPLTLSALKNGQIQVADLFTSDPEITTQDLVALEDVKNLFPAQNIVPLIATSKSNAIVAKTLDAVSASLSTQDLIKMNERLAKHASFDDVANDWIAAKGLNH
ncbi:MAG: ABC transporter substrate-binding protein [Methylorubrum populi]